MLRRCHLLRRTRVGLTVIATLITVLLAVQVLPGLALVSATGPNVLAVPEAIDPTGTTDVTGVLSSLLSRVAPGTVVEFPADARYRVDGTLTIQNQRDLTIDGNGATFFAPTDGSDVPAPRRGARAHWPRLRALWRIRGGSGITMRGLTIEGANPNGGVNPAAYVPELEGQAGLAIQRATGVVIESVTISDTYGDAVYVTGASTNIAVRGSTLERTGRQGVAVVSGQGIVVEDNEIRDVARSVFDLEPVGRALAQDVRLRDNRVGDYGNFLLAAGGGGPGVNDVSLVANVVRGGNGISVYAGVEGRRRSGYRIVDNTGTGKQRPPSGTGRPGLIQLLNLDGVEIRGNRQAVDGVPAISLDRVCGTTIAGNEFAGASTVRRVVAPCGAPGPGSTAGPTAAPTTGPSVAAPADDDEDDGPVAWDVLIPGLVGFAAGLVVAFAVFVGWRRGRAGPSA